MAFSQVSKDNTRNTFILLFLLIITCIFSFIIISKSSQGFFKTKLLNKYQQASPSPTHSPYPLVPDQGTAGTYKISQSNKNGPLFTAAIIDPLNATPSDNISITFTLKSEHPILSVSGKIITDHNPINISLHQKSRSNNLEVWSTNFLLDEPNYYEYIFEMIAIDEQNQSTKYSLPLRTEK